jgi:hypothetical protein
MSADSVPSSKTNIFQSKLIYCRHFRTYSRCAMFDWSDTVFRRWNVTRRRISNTVLEPRYWGREADSPEVCRLSVYQYKNYKFNFRSDICQCVSITKSIYRFNKLMNIHCKFYMCFIHYKALSFIWFACYRSS